VGGKRKRRLNENLAWEGESGGGMKNRKNTEGRGLEDADPVSWQKIGGRAQTPTK